MDPIQNENSEVIIGTRYESGGYTATVVDTGTIPVDDPCEENRGQAGFQVAWDSLDESSLEQTPGDGLDRQWLVGTSPQVTTR